MQRYKAKYLKGFSRPLAYAKYPFVLLKQSQPLESLAWLLEGFLIWALTENISTGTASQIKQLCIHTYKDNVRHCTKPSIEPSILSTLREGGF